MFHDAWGIFEYGVCVVVAGHERHLVTLQDIQKHIMIDDHSCIVPSVERRVLRNINVRIFRYVLHQSSYPVEYALGIAELISAAGVV